MSNQHNKDEELDKIREQVLVEFKQVHKLAPADYTENCTNVVMSIIKANYRHIDDIRGDTMDRYDEIDYDYYQIKLFKNNKWVMDTPLIAKPALIRKKVWS